jgi:multiple sugar transport system substrate-binding protein
MFNIPKKALYKTVSRRKFLELGGHTAVALGAGSLGVGLSSVINRKPVYASSSMEAKWRQYEGSKLVFMSENTPPSFAIRDNIKAFYDLTGIEVEILIDGLPSVQQKVGIDLRSGQADYQLNYVQDKPIGSPFADFYADLNDFSMDETLPLDRQGYGDEVWFENYLDACGVYYDRGPIRAFPYDCAVSCTFYRQDLFEKLSKDFEADYGYRMEFNDDTTYKNMIDFAAFFKMMHARDSSIPYGYGQHHGSFGWTTQLDIQRHMYAQNQWLDFAVDDTLGSKNPGPANWGDAQSVKAMEGYKALADVSHPDNLANGTLELNTVYAAGGVAMQIQYHEFAASVEDAEQSVAAGGRTAYAMGPKGDVAWNVETSNVVNATNCGIGGIGINAGASMDLQRAAFIFASWACSHETQLMVLQGVGGTPTRKSVLDLPEVKAARNRPTNMPNALTFEAVYDKGIRSPNMVLGPKLPKANEYHEIVRVGAQQCIADELSAQEACESIGSELNAMHGI